MIDRTKIVYHGPNRQDLLLATRQRSEGNNPAVICFNIFPLVFDDDITIEQSIHVGFLALDGRRVITPHAISDATGHVPVTQVCKSLRESNRYRIQRPNVLKSSN